jgi:hypothetical protein
MELGLDKKVKVICFDEFQGIKLLLLEGHVSAILRGRSWGAERPPKPPGKMNIIKA